MKSALTATGRTAMPLVFFRGEDGALVREVAAPAAARPRRRVRRGPGRGEQGVVQAAGPVVMARDYLQVGLHREGSGGPGQRRRRRTDGPVTWIGVDPPEETLPAGSVVYTSATSVG